MQVRRHNPPARSCTPENCILALASEWSFHKIAHRSLGWGKGKGMARSLVGIVLQAWKTKDYSVVAVGMELGSGRWCLNTSSWKVLVGFHMVDLAKRIAAVVDYVKWQSAS
jgi:hypothetical protein